jgi:hypothetical protein
LNWAEVKKIVKSIAVGETDIEGETIAYLQVLNMSQPGGDPMFQNQQVELWQGEFLDLDFLWIASVAVPNTVPLFEIMSHEAFSHSPYGIQEIGGNYVLSTGLPLPNLHADVLVNSCYRIAFVALTINNIFST